LLGGWGIVTIPFTILTHIQCRFTKVVIRPDKLDRNSGFL
jgi:hypothetical protein